MSTRRADGFALVTLLMVIAIIGILIALLLQAVQAASNATPAQRQISFSWAKPLAQDYVVVHKVRDLKHPNQCVCVGSPDIIRLPCGRLIASMELWLHIVKPPTGAEGGIDYPNHVKVKASDDRGRTWKQISTNGITWGSLFYDEKKGALYLLGADPHKRDVRIVRSTDGGNSWSEPSSLFASSATQFGAAPTSVGFKNGFVYKTFEGMDISTMFVVAGDMSKDLLDPASWRMSNHLEPPRTAPSFQRKRKIAPMAGRRDRKGIWLLEGNVVEIGGELCVLPRTRIDVQLTTNVCSLLKIKDDGKDLKLEFERFFPMPGGHNKFKIIRDPVTGYYWTVTSLVPDTSLSRAKLEARGFRGHAGNMRRIAMLCYSIDAINWVQAGCVAMSKNPLEAFHYTSQVIDGDDLLVLSRSCVGASKMYNNHDTNMITLHRVKNFRSLALDLRQDFNTTCDPDKQK